jgi:hypothetical protein
MTDLLSHTIRRTDWHHVRHTFLVDIGTAIDIPLMEVSALYESCVLNPPCPKTRYFEIEIDEKREGKTKTALFHTIFPVQATRKPDWRFLIFRIKRGSWTVTERIHFPTDIGEIEWLYTDDFNILFLSSAGRHDLNMLINLITDKLDAIATSFNAGTIIPSEFENQLQCRTTFNTLFREGVDGAFRDSPVYQDYGLITPKNIPRDSVSLAGKDICSRHDRCMFSEEMMAGLHINISEIDELRDLSWLSN